MLELRPYQVEALERTRHAFTKHRRVLLSLPVGAGKTVLASEMIRQAEAKGKRHIFIVHRRELQLQAEAKLTAFGVEPNVWSIQTLARRDFKPADFVVVDEAHHAVADSYMRILGRYETQWILGLTATPMRLDGRGLSKAFDALVVGASVRDLVAKQVLVKPVVFAPSVPDMSRAKIRAGEFTIEAMEEATSPLIGDIVKHWKDAPRGRTVAFAVSIEHSKAIRDAFLAAGVKAEHIDGDTPTHERDAILARLANGDTQIVCNCMILGEGFDLPALDTAILARPTASWSLHVQQVGRIMRIANGKDAAFCLDHAGNHLRHGMVTDEVRFTLEGRDKKTPIKQPTRCPECFCVLEAAPPCPECGWKPEPKPREVTHLDGTLSKLDDIPGKAWYRGKVLEASRSMRKIGWAKHKFKERFGDWPDFRDVDTLYVCRRGFVQHERYPKKCAYCLRPHGPSTPNQRQPPSGSVHQGSRDPGGHPAPFRFTL